MYVYCTPVQWMSIWIAYGSLVGAQWVHYLHGKRTVNPASASLALLGVLPSSIQAIAITNPAAAATIISEAFATGTPTWFFKLDPEVQTYFETAAKTAFQSSTPIPTGKSSNPTAPPSKFTTSFTSSTGFNTPVSSATAGLESSMTTSTSNGLSIGAKAGIGASVPIIAIALAGCGFWLFLRRKHKLTPGHGYDLAESCGNIGDRRDADLPELVERKAPRLVYDVKGQGRIKPTDSSYESELLSRSTLEDTASSRMRQSLVAYHDYPKHIQEMGSSNTELTALQSPKVQPLHELGVADTTRSFSAPKMDAASSIPTISPSGGIPHRTDEEVAKLEAEYVNLQERRQRLLELNRLDEEERRLKKRIEERLGQP